MHGVIYNHAAGHQSSGTVNVKTDFFSRINSLEVQQPVGNVLGALVVDRAPKKDLPLLIGVGAADFIANLLLGVATTKGLVSLAVVLGSLFPIVTALLAFKLLHERLHKIQYLGIVFAIIGVAVISLG